jgi:hypothetical protein
MDASNSGDAQYFGNTNSRKDVNIRMGGSNSRDTKQGRQQHKRQLEATATERTSTTVETPSTAGAPATEETTATAKLKER